MKPDQVHDPVHEKGGPGHITRVFKQGDAEKKDQDIGQKHDDGAHPRNDAVEYKTFGKSARQELIQKDIQVPDAGFDPLHGIGAQDKRRLEHGPDKKDEDRKPQKPVGQDEIDIAGDVGPPAW